MQPLLILLAFAACINDDFFDDRAKAESDGDPFYLGIQLRAGSNESSTHIGFGTHEEHEMGNAGNYAILFDSEEKLFGVYPLTQSLQDYTHKDKSENSEYYDDGLDNVKEGSYLRLLCVYPRNRKLPESCLVILNANNAISEKLEGYDKTGRTSKTLDEILNETWEWEKEGDREKAKDPKRIGFVADNEKDYFTMTNSVYVKDDVRRDTVYIKNKIYPTIQEALKNPTTVYVERMVAKCTLELELPEKDIQDEDETIIKPAGATPLVFFAGISVDGAIDFVDVREWRIKVTGWGINALETQNYLFKNINNKNYFDNWNAKDNYRSYWSEDPHYDYVDRNSSKGRLVYPWQYRWAIDDPDIRYYSDPDLLSDHHNYNYLRNYSYYDFEFENHEGENNKHNVESFDFEKTVYVPENTYDKAEVAGYGGKDGHDSRDELLAGTHLLVGAELEVWDNEKKYRIYDLYRDRNGIYYESERECFVSLVHSFNQLLISQSVMEFVPYDWDKGGGRVTSKNGKTITAKDTLVAKSSGSFMLCYNNKILDEKELASILKLDSTEFATQYGHLPSATLRTGDGRRLPWINEAIENKKLAIKKVTRNSEGKYEIATEGDLNLPIHIKTKNKYGATIAGDKMWDDADVNDVKSILYEWLGAVDHFNNGKMYYAIGIDNTPDINLKSDKTYGVVRNSWYQFKLSDIKSIGVPVDNPDEPIVPQRISNNDQINVSVKILPWHEVKGDIPVFFW